jgi:RND family efflux transporter MFP subunit
MTRDAKRLRLLALAALLLPALAACQQPDAVVEKPARLVRVAPVALQDYAYTAALTGEVQARSRIDMAFRLTGQITEVNVEVGDHVTATQVLARIDSEGQQADLGLAEASVRAAEAALDQATAALARQQTLLDSGLVTLGKYDQADQDRRTATSSLESAVAQRQAALNALSYTELRADADGIVTRVNRDPGEIAQSAQPVLSIAYDGPRDAVFSAYELLLFTAADDLSGAMVSVALVADDSVRAVGHVREISPTVDPRAGTVRVKVSLEDAPASMALGSLVTGRVTLPAAPAIVVPWSSLALDHGLPAVWLVDSEARTAFIRHVEVKKYTTHSVLLASGVNAGDLLVTEGGQFLYEGRPVLVTMGDKP